MWTYILRRLLVMIPTLFGVTVVSFCIMQLAPGDPMDNLGAAGLSSESGQTREAYLIRKRDLKLDKPLLLNFNYFRDYSGKVRIAAYYLGRTKAEVIADLADLAEHPDKLQNAARLKFLRSLGIEDFQQRLEDPRQRDQLARAIRGDQDQGLMGGGLVRVFCEDAGVHGVPPAIDILRSDQAGLQEKIGAIRALNYMVVDPFAYTYSHDPSPRETPLVMAVWKTWWERAEPTFPKLDAKRRKAVRKRFQAIVASGSRTELFAGLDYFDPAKLEPFQRADMRFFVEKLLGASDLQEKIVASLGLRLYLGKVLLTDVPPQAIKPRPSVATTKKPRPSVATTEKTRPPVAALCDVAENWLVYFNLHRKRYQPSVLAKTWYIVSDTQYANMFWRLLTFNFGRTTLKTREPVGQKILAAVLVSAPLMVLAQLMIYFVAVPLGIICAVNRGNWIDRLISLKLFLLYSIPPFVAGMLFLLFFCYGDYLRLFPMEGLHSDGAEDYGLLRYSIDYLWHIILPVACLSLFSLAGMAMYSRTSMLDVIGQDYIRTARAKGLSEEKVILKHGLRNSLIPIITLFSNLLPAMLGGSVLIEVIFGIPGMGTLSWASIEQKDFPTLMALIYIDAIVVMLSILMTDMLYVLVDPRISFEAQGSAA